LTSNTALRGVDFMFPLNAATRVGLNVLIVFGVIWVLYLGQTLFLPLIISLLLASVLGPAALWLHQRLNFNWTLACATAVFGLIALFVALAFVFAVSLPRLLQILPNLNDNNKIVEIYNEKIRPQIESMWPWELDEDLFPKEVKENEVGKIRIFQTLVEKARQYGPQLIFSIGFFGLNIFWQLILILFILFFLLLEGGMLTRRIVEIFGPSDEVQNKAREVLYDMARQVKTYLVWRTIINVWLAIVVGLVFLFLGLNQPWTWAILLAILNYVPYLGPLLAAIPPFLDSLITVPHLAVVVLIFYTAIIVIEGYLIVPLLMGRSMDLNATTVMLACLFWDLVWGTVGLFLAMPLMAALRAICFHVPGWRPWGNLMSTGEGEAEPVILKKPEPPPEPPPSLPPEPGFNGQGR
jgi:AI-2 transport protein TqsA